MRNILLLELNERVLLLYGPGIGKGARISEGNNLDIVPTMLTWRSGMAQKRRVNTFAWTDI